jgi:hypothetical protein
MELHLKQELPFDNSLLFNGFLPESEADTLNLSLNEGKFRAAISISDRKRQLDDISDIPSDPEQLKRYINLPCSGLTMELLATDVPNDVVEALRANMPTEGTETFGKLVFDVVLGIQNSIIEFCRNVMKQYWLEPLTVNPDNYQSFLDERRTLWLDSDGNWKRFRVSRENSITIVCQVLEGGVDLESWRAMQIFIEQRRRASMRDVLIANCIKHLDQGNGRLAIVESVITLEAAIKQLLPKVILRLPGTPQIDEKMIDRLVEKAGLRNVAEVGLLMISASAKIDMGDIQMATEAIEVRNEIIHGPRRAVDGTTARKYVLAINRIVETFEHWIEIKTD